MHVAGGHGAVLRKAAVVLAAQVAGQLAVPGTLGVTDPGVDQDPATEQRVIHGGAHRDDAP